MTHQTAESLTLPMQEEATAPSEPLRLCPNCGTGFPEGGRGLGKKFCQSSCRYDFGNRSKAEGAVVIHLVKVHHATRHAKAGSREAEVGGRARAELAEIIRMYLEADAEKGRPSLVPYVEELLTESLYCDRTRKF